MPDTNNHDRGDIWSAGLLAAATVASAWCAYQAALWSGDQLRGLAKASSAQFDSLRAESTADAAAMIDVGTFLNLVSAQARGDDRTVAYLRAHARSEFRPVLERWMARGGDSAATLPFEQQDYKLAARQNAEAFRKLADADVEMANQANDHSDLFVLHTVLFAMSLFFLGSSTSASRRITRRAMLGIGTLVLVLGVVSMLRLPRAPTAPRPSDLKAAREEAGH